MSDPYVDYWADALGDALCEIDKFNALTSEERAKVAKSLHMAHECYGIAFGHDVISRNYSAARRDEEGRLRKEVQRERDKVVCRECGGAGRLRYNSGPWAVDTGCMKCNGDGRHDP
ncbi:hypothetical protein GOL29_03330 [Sinorhizobium medicae]|nr:hypothetical protein [Sinorhizobium medicae]